MNATDLIRRLHQHRAWSNRNLQSSISALSDEELRRPFAIGQGSVWKSLLHLYASEFVWLEALKGNETPIAPGDLPGKLPGNQQAEGAFESLPALVTKWKELDQRWREYLDLLHPDSLDDIVIKMTSATPGKRLGARRSDVLMHVCTHAQYTTAQVVNMLRQLGIGNLPEVMLISLARAELGN